MRSAKEDGARVVRAVHHSPSQGIGLRAYRAFGQKTHRAPNARGVGRAGRGDQGPPGDVEPCAHAAPFVRAGV